MFVQRFSCKQKLSSENYSIGINYMWASEENLMI